MKADDLEIVTDHLVLRLPLPDEALRVADYYERNRAHFAPWDPARADSFFTARYWKRRLSTNRREFERSVAMRTFAALRRDPVGPLVGHVNLSQITRGAFHSAMLGYGIDAEHEGRGLASEGVGAVVDFAFKRLRLHRVQANHLPENERSARLLAHLGFEREGYAKDYLRIAGRWRDHVLAARRNPDWRARR